MSATTNLALAYNPVFLGIRFLLELFALYCFGLWGWRRVPGPLRYVAVVAIPVVVAIVWGDFATPGDEARSGDWQWPDPAPWPPSAPPPHGIRDDERRCHVVRRLVEAPAVVRRATVAGWGPLFAQSKGDQPVP